MIVVIQETAGDPDIPYGAGPWWVILGLCVVVVIGFVLVVVRK